MPLYPPPVAGTTDILQTASAVVSTNATTTSATYADLLSITLTVSAGSSLDVYASFCADNSSYGTPLFMQIIVGATVLAATSLCQYAHPEIGQLYKNTGVLSAASYTVKLQWKTASGTARCTALSLAQPEHASLVVMELGR